VNLVSEDGLLYADAEANFDEAKVVIFGIPFDRTSSHRAGSALAPNAIRQESYNFESYLFRYNFNLENVKIHDMGNYKNCQNITELMESLPEIIQDIIQADKFLITLGGEHSITLPILNSHLIANKNPGFGIIYFDAHLDFRDTYLQEKFSHACVARRINELVGSEKIVEIGTRSYSEQESIDLEKAKLKTFASELVNKLGMEQIIKESIEYLATDKIYLSIDMDVIDPAYAPGVGNPEYFGLTPQQIREGIEILGQYLIGADIVEVSPPFDNGNTSALAAQLIQIIISQVCLKR
jgi:agmatinase